MALHAVFRSGSIFKACDDLLQTGDAYSAEEKKHRARAVVRKKKKKKKRFSSMA